MSKKSRERRGVTLSSLQRTHELRQAEWCPEQKSRGELNDDPLAAARWKEFRQRFNAWRGG